MARVITFSTKFPSHHPKRGQPTLFVEKLALGFSQLNVEYDVRAYEENRCKSDQNYHFDVSQCDPKFHTIRRGKRWRAGDKFSARVWSGKPYQSKMITIATSVEIKKVWDIEIELPIRKVSVVNDEGLWWQYDKGNTIQEIIANDGLTPEDFWSWFSNGKEKVDFSGQIICWNDKIEY